MRESGSSKRKGDKKNVRKSERDVLKTVRCDFSDVWSRA